MPLLTLKELKRHRCGEWWTEINVSRTLIAQKLTSDVNDALTLDNIRLSSIQRHCFKHCAAVQLSEKLQRPMRFSVTEETPSQAMLILGSGERRAEPIDRYRCSRHGRLVLQVLTKDPKH